MVRIFCRVPEVWFPGHDPLQEREGEAERVGLAGGKDGTQLVWVTCKNQLDRGKEGGEGDRE